MQGGFKGNHKKGLTVFLLHFSPEICFEWTLSTILAHEDFISNRTRRWLTNNGFYRHLEPLYGVVTASNTQECNVLHYLGTLSILLRNAPAFYHLRYPIHTQRGIIQYMSWHLSSDSSNLDIKKTLVMITS